MTDQQKTAWETFTEEVEVSGQHLLTEINRLIAEGNVRKLVLKTADERVFLSIPLTAGAVAGGLVAISAPWLAIIAGLASLMGKVKIEIVRTGQVANTASTAQSDAPASSEPPAQH